MEGNYNEEVIIDKNWVDYTLERDGRELQLYLSVPQALAIIPLREMEGNYNNCRLLLCLS